MLRYSDIEQQFSPECMQKPMWRTLVGQDRHYDREGAQIEGIGDDALDIQARFVARATSTAPAREAARVGAGSTR